MLNWQGGGGAPREGSLQQEDRSSVWVNKLRPNCSPSCRAKTNSQGTMALLVTRLPDCALTCLTMLTGCSASTFASAIFLPQWKASLGALHPIKTACCPLCGSNTSRWIEPPFHITRRARALLVPDFETSRTLWRASAFAWTTRTYRKPEARTFHGFCIPPTVCGKINLRLTITRRPSLAETPWHWRAWSDCYFSNTCKPLLLSQDCRLCCSVANYLSFLDKCLTAFALCAGWNPPAGFLPGAWSWAGPSWNKEEAEWFYPHDRHFYYSASLKASAK